MDNINNEQLLLIKIARNINNLESYNPQEELLNNLNWDYFIELLLQHAILPLVSRYICKYIPEKFRNKFYSLLYSFHRKIDLYVDELKKLLELASYSNVNMTLIKGIALSTIVYGDIYKRGFSDLDLLVDEANFLNFAHILEKVGYKQYYNMDKRVERLNELPVPFLKWNPGFHEYQFTKFSRKNDKVNVEIKKMTSGIDQRLANDLRLANVEITIKDYKVHTTNITFTLLLICASIYERAELDYWSNNSMRMLDYIDLYVFINKYKHILNWNEVLAIASENNLLYQVSYAIKSVENIYGQFLSSDILEKFKPLIIKSNNPERYLQLNWETGFLYRLFNGKERLTELWKIYRKMNYSKHNANYLNAIYVKKVEYLEQFHENASFQFYISDLGSSIYIWFYNSNNNIYILFQVPNDLLVRLSDYKIVFEYLPNDFTYMEAKVYLIITEENSKIMCFQCFDENDLYYSSSYIDNIKCYQIDLIKKSYDTSLVLVTLPCKEMKIVINQNNYYLCYNIILLKRVFNNYFHNIFENTTFPGMYKVLNFMEVVSN